MLITPRARRHARREKTIPPQIPPSPAIDRSTRRPHPITAAIPAAASNHRRRLFAVYTRVLTAADKRPPNRYSVEARAVGRTVQLHAYAERIVVRLDGELVADHPRRFGRDQVVY